MPHPLDDAHETARPAQIVRVAQRLKWQRDRALAERDQAEVERARLVATSAAYEAMLAAVLGAGEEEG